MPAVVFVSTLEPKDGRRDELVELLAALAAAGVPVARGAVAVEPRARLAEVPALPERVAS